MWAFRKVQKITGLHLTPPAKLKSGLSLIKRDQFVWQQFFTAGCAGRKTMAAVIDDGLNFETVIHTPRFKVVNRDGYTI
jgi:hypothetical protein